jgi:hypothetical protein
MAPSVVKTPTATAQTMHARFIREDIDGVSSGRREIFMTWWGLL